MNLTKAQKIYGGVLVVAAAAWGIDTATSGATAPAARPHGGGKRAAVVVTTAPAGSVNGTLGMKLRGFLDSSGRPPAVRDVFRPSELWIATNKGKDVAPAAFRQAHHLTAVINTRGGGQAVVDGSLYRIGDELDGFKLVGVGGFSAKFSSAGQTADLHVETDALGP